MNLFGKFYFIYYNIFIYTQKWDLSDTLVFFLLPKGLFYIGVGLFYRTRLKKQHYYLLLWKHPLNRVIKVTDLTYKRPEYVFLNHQIYTKDDEIDHNLFCFGFRNKL